MITPADSVYWHIGHSHIDYKVLFLTTKALHAFATQENITAAQTGIV